MGSIGAQAGVRAGKRGRAASLQRRRETFLAHFAANCSVREAAAAAGVPVSTLYLWRKTEPDFAAEWAEALATGYEMLEARLVEHALAGEVRETLDGVEDMPVAPVNVTLALKLIELRRRAAPRRLEGRPLKVPAPGETLKVLLARLDLIETRKRALAEREVAQPALPAPVIPPASDQATIDGVGA